MAENKKKLDIIGALKNGIITENPVLRLVLGTCPTLAVSTSLTNALGMGVAATAVLICSNTVISLLRNIIPSKVRIPAYITVIAGFVSIVQLIVKAYAPALDKSLGVFLPLIVVNCILLGRAEMFASKTNPVASAIDGLAMGIGFTSALMLMALVRETLGSGSFFGMKFISEDFFIQPMTLLVLPPGGFFVFGILIAIVNKLTADKPIVEEFGCENCPSASSCSLAKTGGCSNDK